MYIVTGGAGFIGSAFVAKLNQEGIRDVIVVDHLGTSEKWRNLVNLTFSDYLEKDRFLDLILNDRLALKPTAVVHLGACSDTTERDASFLVRNNYRYSKVLAEWALKKKVRFIYASSAATYGDGTAGFSDDIKGVSSLKPLNMYGYSKQLFDLWAIQTSAYRRITGLKFFNVFGPNEYHKGEMSSVVYKAFHQARESGRIGLFQSYRSEYADGEQQRDFLYVKDCVDVMWNILQDEKIAGIFNLGSGKARTWNDLARAVFLALDLPSEIDYIEMPEEIRDRYQYHTEAEMEAVRRAGIPTEFRTLEEGVADYVQNYLLAEDPYL